MSTWKAFVETICHDKSLASACIAGSDGAIWYQSDGLGITEAMAKQYHSGFSDPGGLRAAGVKISGTKYMLLQTTDTLVIGKRGPGGIVIAKTAKGLIIGVYGPTSSGPQANITVQKMADYLKEQGC